MKVEGIYTHHMLPYQSEVEADVTILNMKPVIFFGASNKISPHASNTCMFVGIVRMWYLRKYMQLV